MKKHEIKHAVAKAAEKHLPKAIKEIGESHARRQVYDAIEPSREEPHAAPLKEAEHGEKHGETVIHSHDPRLGA